MKEARGAGCLELAGISFSTYYSTSFFLVAIFPQRLKLKFQKSYYPIFKLFTYLFNFLIVSDEFFPLKKSIAVCTPVNYWLWL
ncbi:hypothetical protein [uncultured Mucilaginibacter sp.]|uniref:hypothetical protein n=1 Tax=uncultured Mucilaginibacter sp. TaxID=797541 RepID=UPI00262D8A6A|nr:hypothetical protein [uncultured Mucilaginibacter sp.]